MSEQLFLIARFLISTEVVYLQRWNGWCHMKLLPSRRKFCVHHKNAILATTSITALKHDFCLLKAVVTCDLRYDGLVFLEDLVGGLVEV